MSEVPPKVNMLVPTGTKSRLDPFREGVVRQVRLSPNTNDGDVYPQGGKLAPTKTGLLKLASAANISIEIRIKESNRDYVLAEATAQYVNASGSLQRAVGTYEIDMEVISDDIRSKGKSKGDTDAKIEKEILQFRRYKLQRAETGAINRAIRGILSVKNAYSAAELANPFAVPSVVFSPDFTDPEVKAAVIAKFAGNSNLLFGGMSEPAPALEAPRQPVEIRALPEPEPTPPEEVYPEETDGPPEEPETQGPPEDVEDESGGFQTPPCETCGSPTAFREGVKKNGQPWYAYFCTAEKEHVKWMYSDPRTNPDQTTIDGSENGPGY